MRRGIVVALVGMLALPAAAGATDNDIRGLWRAAPLTVRIAEYGDGFKGSILSGFSNGSCSVATGEQAYIMGKEQPVHAGTAYVYRVVNGVCQKKLGEARFYIRGGASFDVLRVCVRDPFDPNDTTDIDAEVTRQPGDPTRINGEGVGSSGCYELGRQTSAGEEGATRTASDYFGKFSRKACGQGGNTSGMHPHKLTTFMFRLKKVLADPIVRVVSVRFNGQVPRYDGDAGNKLYFQGPGRSTRSTWWRRTRTS